MKKWFWGLLLWILCIVPVGVSASVAIGDINAPEDRETIYLFYGKDCPYCKRERTWLTSLSNQTANIQVEYHEVHEEDELDKKIRKALDIEDDYIPLTIIGSNYWIGYNDSIQEQIKEALEKYRGKDYCDIVSLVKEGKSTVGCRTQNDGIYTQENFRVLPVIGEVNDKMLFPPLIAIIIGFIDGLHPWMIATLLLLLHALYAIPSKGKKLLYGISYFLSYAFVYFACMLVILLVSYLYPNPIIWYIAGVLSMLAFFYTMYQVVRTWKTKSMKHPRLEKMQTKFEEITKQKNLFYGVVQMIEFAALSSLLEIVYSAFVPLFVAQFIGMNTLSTFTTFLSTSLYLVAFLLPCLIIFVISMFRKKELQISSKHFIYSRVIMGIILLLFALLLFVKPEWIMFNFA